jgi:DNA-directed RNA polymerase beta subunit
MFKKVARYRIEPCGLPIEKTYVSGGDVVIGKTKTIRRIAPVVDKVRTAMSKRQDISITCKPEDDGQVIDVRLYFKPSSCVAVVSLLTNHTFDVGDKLSTDHSQKGTCSYLVSPEDMPFTSTGMTVDVMVSPLSIPSRMTMGSLMECITGKAVAITGDIDLGVDNQRLSTSLKHHTRRMGEIIKEYGFAQTGSERFFDGRTGKMIDALVFTGMIDMYRLVHMSKKKNYARSTGPRDPISRQPNNGRRSGGGLRVGELEQAGIIGFGASAVQHEKICTQSDPSDIYICVGCKHNVLVNIQLGIMTCMRCETDLYTRRVTLPYSMLLLAKEVMALGVTVEFDIDDSDEL